MVRHNGYICGCYFLRPPINKWSVPEKQYVTQVNIKAHATILASTSRTTLTQTFVNPSESKAIKDLGYSFPLYDGVSVVGFTCTIGDRTIVGEVKEKDKARAVFKEAKERGEVAGLLEELPDASDVFITKLGNVPPGATIVVDITYLGELKHDAEVDGVRFTIPTFIAPRYKSYPSGTVNALRGKSTSAQGFEVTIDAELGEGAYIREMRSPSHPIAVSLGTTSLDQDADPQPNKASATLSLGTAELDKDFVLQVVAKEIAVPKAILETHPTIPGQRALMATLVPKFALPPERPEIVFVCDRSGSMGGSSIVALRNALKVFLKSLPIGTKFNICSFGSHFTFLWPKSKSYSQTSLDEAMGHVESFAANYGGTEMYSPMQETIKRRYSDMNLEIFLVTDGEIWDQQRLFDLLNEEIGAKQAPIRVFTLGIGESFSSALVEGVARAGNGFAQAVGTNEKLDGKVVRMLKAALSPHINDYTLDVTYEDGSVDKAADSLAVTLGPSAGGKSITQKIKAKISLFDTSADLDATEAPVQDSDGQAKYSHLPTIEPPKILQAPNNIPPLFAFSRTTVYLLLSPLAEQSTPTKVTLRGTSKHGPLELDIPVQILREAGQTIHQLAVKKAVQELEDGRGWLSSAKNAATGELLKKKNEGRYSDFAEREAVRLGVQFQVAGKFCSFVAVEKKEKETDKKARDADDWEFLDDEVDKLTLEDAENPRFGDGSQTKSRSRGGLSMFGSSRAASRMAAPPSVSRFGPTAASSAAAVDLAQIQPKGFGGAPATMRRSRGGLAPMKKERKQEASLDKGAEMGSDSEDDEEDPYTPMMMAMPAPGGSPLGPQSMGYSPAHYVSASFGSAVSPPPPASASALKPAAIPTDPLQALIEIQTFEGYWTLSEDLCKAVGAKMALSLQTSQSKGIDAKVLATALAVYFLTTKLKKDADSWELVVDKAKGWLEMNGCEEDNEVWKTVAGLI